MLLPLTHAQRVARFGSFSFKAAPTAGNPEAVTVDLDWVVRNIVTVPCPQLSRLGVGPVRLHRLAASSFLELWRTWEAEGLLGIVTTWNGSYVPRFKRGRAGVGTAGALSNHSWGNAFDIDARTYPLGSKVAPLAPIRKLVPAAERLGWFWGGGFKSRPDGMHFEYVGAPPAADLKAAARGLLDGKLTLAERKQAQAALGLTADGKVGPKTLARAREVLGLRS